MQAMVNADPETTEPRTRFSSTRGRGQTLGQFFNMSSTVNTKPITAPTSFHQRHCSLFLPQRQAAMEATKSPTRRQKKMSPTVASHARRKG